MMKNFQPKQQCYISVYANILILAFDWLRVSWSRKPIGNLAVGKEQNIFFSDQLKSDCLSLSQNSFTPNAIMCVPSLCIKALALTCTSIN